MKKNEIMQKISSKFGRAGLKIKKHSPEILIIAGVIGTVTSAVMACRATTKINDVLDGHTKAVEKIHTAKDAGSIQSKTESAIIPYSEDDAKKDLTLTYVQTGLKFAKLYAPAVILGILSLTGVVASNQILRKRNIALMAAYATLDKSFKKYRARVAEKYGEDEERAIRFNIKAQDVEVAKTDDDGNTTTETVTMDVAQPSDFARFFDETSLQWDRLPENNLFFLKMQLIRFNDLLKARGHVFLNEVYDALGLTRSTAGQVVGWIYDPDNPDIDSYIDFGIYDPTSGDFNRKRMFVNGDEQSILLDFNVDGVIYDKI